MKTIFILAAALLFCAPAIAAPPCDAADNDELCTIAADTLADNPSFETLRNETQADANARAERHAARRTRARSLLDAEATPNWRDLYRAGYVIGYGDTRDERLLAMAIAIRALSLAPDEPDVRFLVAMTVDSVTRTYRRATLRASKVLPVRSRNRCDRDRLSSAVAGASVLGGRVVPHSRRLSALPGWCRRSALRLRTARTFDVARDASYVALVLGE